MTKPTDKPPLDIYYPGDRANKAVHKLFVDIPWNTDYTFKFMGDAQQLTAYISAMRTCVSRGRNKARKLNVKLRNFRLRLVEQKPTTDGRGMIVTVRRELATYEKLADELPNPFISAMGEKS